MAEIAETPGGPGYYDPSQEFPWIPPQYRQPAQEPSWGQPAPIWGAPGQGGAGGGGGGVGGGGTTTTPWTGVIPSWNALPWQTWETTPWANVPSGKAEQAQAWFNVMLPWLQASQQGGQWQQEFAWRKLADQWTQQYQEQQLAQQLAQELWSRGFQEQQFAHQQAQDVWGQGFQEQQLAQQQALEEARRLQEAENVRMQAFGRRWAPATRWM